MGWREREERKHEDHGGRREKASKAEARVGHPVPSTPHSPENKQNKNKEKETRVPPAPPREDQPLPWRAGYFAAGPESGHRELLSRLTTASPAPPFVNIKTPEGQSSPRPLLFIFGVHRPKRVTFAASHKLHAEKRNSR